MPQNPEAKPFQMLDTAIEDMKKLYEKVPRELRSETHGLLIRLVQTSTEFNLYAAHLFDKHRIQFKKRGRMIQHLSRMVDNQHRLN